MTALPCLICRVNTDIVHLSEREDVEVSGGGKSCCVVQTRWSSMEEVLCVRDRAPGSFL